MTDATVDTPTIPPARLAEHVQVLALTHNIQLSLRPGNRKGVSYVDYEGVMRVEARPVVDNRTYVIVLHEMGHLVHPCGAIRRKLGLKEPQNRQETTWWCNLRLAEEYAAWEWAHNIALEWTQSMSAVEKYYVREYQLNAQIAAQTGIDAVIKIISEEEEEYGDINDVSPLRGQDFYPRFREILLEEKVPESEIITVWESRPIEMHAPDYVFHEHIVREAARHILKLAKEHLESLMLKKGYHE